MHFFLYSSDSSYSCFFGCYVFNSELNELPECSLWLFADISHCIHVHVLVRGIRCVLTVCGEQ